MNELIIIESDLVFLKTRLQSSKFETCAILLTNPIKRGDYYRLLVKEIHMVTPDGYRKRNTSQAIIDPLFLAPLVKRAKINGFGLVFVHTHPGEQSIPNFSTIDDDGEILLSKFIKSRKVEGPHAAIVFGENLCRSRILNSRKAVKVISIGKTRETLFDPVRNKLLDRFHQRQVRILGNSGQQTITKLRVGIVGLGGTGSIICQQLTYLGIQNFLLIDPDNVEQSNLNRLVGAYKKHIGLAKIRVAKEHVKKISSKVEVEMLQRSILDDDVAKKLSKVDFIFCCTDSQSSRAVLNQLAYQYLVPTIDIGVSITTIQEIVSRITGRVQLLSPDHACLTCQELLDANIVRQEFLTPEQIAQDPYFIGAGEPQPAVISINSTMASLAITMFLNVVTKLPGSARYLIYDAIQGRIRSATASQYPTCIVCSRHGALGRGDQWSLPVRLVSPHE
ncbi:MAG: ThiF family adenylyltransferase [Bacteroidota bacterium]